MASRVYSGSIRNVHTSIQGDLRPQGDIYLITVLAAETSRLVDVSPQIFEDIQPNIQPKLAASAMNLMKVAVLAQSYEDRGGLLDAAGRSEIVRLAESSEDVLKKVKSIITGGIQWQRPIHTKEDVEQVLSTLDSTIKSLDSINEKMISTSDILEKALEDLHKQATGYNATVLSVTTASIKSLSDAGGQPWASLRQALELQGVPRNVADNNRQKIIGYIERLNTLSQSQSIVTISHSSQYSDTRRQRKSVDLRRFMNSFKEKRMLQSDPNERLIHTCIREDIDEIQRALADDANVNKRGQSGHVPLICAIVHGNHGIVEYLLSIGADAELADEPRPPALKRTPVIAAVENGCRDILQLLMSSGASPDSSTPEFRGAALDLALAKWDHDCVRILLENGADPNINLHSISHLDRAVGQNKHDHISLLLQHGAVLTEAPIEVETPRNSRSPPAPPPGTLQLVMEKRSPESLKVILSHLGVSSKPKIDDQRLLFRATVKGWADCVQILLDFGADPRLTAMSGIYGTATDMNEHVICNAMQAALGYGHRAIAKQLLEITGPDTTIVVENGLSKLLTRRTTMLHLAVKTGSSRGIEEVLEVNNDLNVRDEFGRTALHQMPAMKIEHLRLALRYFNEELVNAQDHRGRTALHFAVLAASGHALLTLLSNGARIDLSDSSGITPLHLAIITFRTFELYFPVVATLLSKRANPNAATNDGDTILHHLARKHVHPSEILRMMVLLVSRGQANLDIKDGHGHTARSKLREVLRTWVLEGSDPHYPMTMTELEIMPHFDQPNRKYHDLDLARQWLFPAEDTT